MSKNVDNRLVCSEDKKSSIKKSIAATAERRKNQVLHVYECKIVEKRLNNKQREQLSKLFVEGKWFYNHVLNIHQNGLALNEINSTNIKSVEHFDKDKNKILSELEVLSSQEKQAIVTRMASNERTIMSLVMKGLQKHGNLQFKSELNSIPLKQYGSTYKFKSANKVKIQGIQGTVLVRTGHQLDSIDEFANANLVRKADGYYLKITTFTNKENILPTEGNGKEIGLDFGIKTNITTSEGEKIDVSVEESGRLKALQRELQRKVKGSNNRYKTIKKIQRQYLTLMNRKKDKANKIVSKLKKFSCIVMQDEQISNWQKGLFGKQVQHSCMGLIKAKLKALPQTIVLNKWIPTTKMCPKCGSVNSISLEDRVFKCNCGYELDRDVHSAMNMVEIKNLVFSNNNFVPTEHREITLEEFKTAVGRAYCASDKSER
jgi:putative transposase